MGSRKPSALFFTQNFPPETHAGANRAGAMAAALSREFDLVVVTNLPSHPHPDYHPPGAAARHDSRQTYRIVRTQPFSPHRPGYLRRGTRELGMAMRLVCRRLPRADVIIASSPSFFTGPAGWLLAGASRASFVWDIRDLTWTYALESLQHSGPRTSLRLAGARLMSLAAEFLVRKADAIVASNAGIAAAARALRSDERSVVLVPNGVSREIHQELDRVPGSHHDRSSVRVLYAGAVGHFQGLQTLVEVATQLPNVEFRIVGDGPDRANLERRAAQARLENLHFTGFVAREQLFEHYASADILFAQLRDLGVMEQATFPSKVFEYLSAGKPIVYAGRGIAADFLQQSGAALIAEPENPESIRQNISKLLGDVLLREEMGILGRRYGSRHIREDLMIDAARLLREELIAHTNHTSTPKH